jgi:ATP-dependent DNA helicase DinG
VDSEFPLENRPIFFKEVGDMSYKHINNTLPLMAAEVSALMTKYTKQKGIVFTQSFKNNKYIVDHVQTTEHADRVLTHSGDMKGSREACINNHKEAQHPTVIFSPSMTEGLDLKEDLGRFGILVKVPYPALDPYVRARMQRDSDWYTWLTALKLVQASGRIVRSRTDRGHIWILDSGFRVFLRRAYKILPKWWTNSIIDMKKIEPTTGGSTWEKPKHRNSHAVDDEDY